MQPAVELDYKLNAGGDKSNGDSEQSESEIIITETKSKNFNKG
jgi:hypothetical protein